MNGVGDLRRPALAGDVEVHHELGELVLVQVAVLVLVRLGDLPLDPGPELAGLVLQAPGGVRLQGVQDVLQGLLVQSTVLVAVLRLQ